MSDNFLSLSTRSVSAGMANDPARVDLPAPAGEAQAKRARTPASLEVKSKTAVPAEGKPRLLPETFRDIRVHFKIDPKTHDVTVLMVDKATQRIIRSIPPEELRQLDEGELIELLA